MPQEITLDTVDNETLEKIAAALATTKENNVPTTPMPTNLSPNALAEMLGKTNAHKLYCPRAECRCLLVEPGAAATRIGLPPATDELLGAAAELPAAGDLGAHAKTGVWFALADAFSFANIGFSKRAAAPGKPGAALQYLCCADCDVGPLGFAVAAAGEPQCFLAAARVRFGKA